MRKLTRLVIACDSSIYYLTIWLRQGQDPLSTNIEFCKSNETVFINAIDQYQDLNYTQSQNVMDWITILEPI